MSRLVTGVRCYGEAITAGGRTRAANGGIRDDVTSDDSRTLVVVVVVVGGINGRGIAAVRRLDRAPPASGRG